MPAVGEKIILGSRKLYILESTGDTLPGDEDLEKKRIFGAYPGRATLDYRPTFEAKI